jgi:hypothetical protein
VIVELIRQSEFWKSCLGVLGSDEFELATQILSVFVENPVFITVIDNAELLYPKSAQVPTASSTFSHKAVQLSAPIRGLTSE